MQSFVRLFGAALAATLSGAVEAGAAEVPDFYAHWGDGRAEVSSYEVVQPRYGELRRGYGVMIFVTEDINRNTLIKVESPRTPPGDRVYVLKLNNLLKFSTGIYDYAVMTSVFSAVEGGGKESFALRKLTLGAQEWCGQVYDEALVRGGRMEGQLNSYFESEGRHSYELTLPSDFASEDHLLIRIRELRGPVMAPGEELEVALLPSLWSLRRQHRPHETVRAVLSKQQPETIVAGERSFEAVPWRWDTGERHKTVWVEKDYPRRILAWEDSGGGRGRLIETLREPYWKLNSNTDAVLRKRLGIP